MQGHEHPLLQSRSLVATGVHWIGPPPREWNGASRCAAQRRSAIASPIRPAPCCARAQTRSSVQFDEPQRTPTPGQFVVLYDGDRCLGGATIDAAAAAAPALKAAV